MFEGAAQRLCKWLGTELYRVSIEALWRKTRVSNTDESFFSHYHKVKTRFLMKSWSLTWIALRHSCQFYPRSTSTTELNFEKTITQSTKLHHMCVKSRNGYGSSQLKSFFVRCLTDIWCRNYGSTLTKDEYDAALNQICQHNAWFKKHILNEDTIMILPRYSLDYRDEYLP